MSDIRIFMPLKEGKEYGGEKIEDPNIKAVKLIKPKVHGIYHSGGMGEVEWGTGKQRGGTGHIPPTNG